MDIMAMLGTLSGMIYIALMCVAIPLFISARTKKSLLKSKLSLWLTAIATVFAVMQAIGATLSNDPQLWLIAVTIIVVLLAAHRLSQAIDQYIDLKTEDYKQTYQDDLKVLHDFDLHNFSTSDKFKTPNQM